MGPQWVFGTDSFDHHVRFSQAGRDYLAVLVGTKMLSSDSLFGQVL